MLSNQEADFGNGESEGEEELETHKRQVAFGLEPDNNEEDYLNDYFTGNNPSQQPSGRDAKDAFQVNKNTYSRHGGDD